MTAAYDRYKALPPDTLHTIRAAAHSGEEFSEIAERLDVPRDVVELAMRRSKRAQARRDRRAQKNATGGRGEVSSNE